jgi:carboxyl-terminal processing protease
MSITFPIYEQFVYSADGGLGMAIRQVDDGHVLVNYITEGSPADQAGIKLRAEIIAVNGMSIEDALNNTKVWSAPFSTEHVTRLQQLRYITRYLIGTEVEVSFQNPDENEKTVILTAASELESFAFSSFNVARTGYEYPVEVEFIDPYLVINITSFFDDDPLTVRLWERILSQANLDEIPAIIIDMRNNGGGSGFLADQMAAYFFDEQQNLGNSGRFDEKEGSFFFDPEHTQSYFLPPEELRYSGEVLVLVGPNCASACEFFSYDMTIAGRATIVGQYPTAGLGGGIEQFFIPDGIRVTITVSRAVDANGNIHIEGIGVVPDIVVPVTEETLFADYDVVLQAAIDYLNETLGIN